MQTNFYHKTDVDMSIIVGDSLNFKFKITSDDPNFSHVRITEIHIVGHKIAKIQAFVEPVCSEHLEVLNKKAK